MASATKSKILKDRSVICQDLRVLLYRFYGDTNNFQSLLYIHLIHFSLQKLRNKFGISHKDLCPQTPKLFELTLL